MLQNFRKKATTFFIYVVGTIVFYELISWSVFNIIRDGDLGNRILFVVAAIAAHGVIVFIKQEFLTKDN